MKNPTIKFFHNQKSINYFHPKKMTDEEPKTSDIYYVAIYKKSDKTLVLENWLEPSMQKLVTKYNRKMIKAIQKSDLEENEKKTWRVKNQPVMYLAYVDPYDHMLISCVNHTYDEHLGNNILIVKNIFFTIIGIKCYGQ
jgi:hypothetical protein